MLIKTGNKFPALLSRNAGFRELGFMFIILDALNG